MNQSVENFSLILSFVLTVLVISSLNQAVKDFFLNQFIVFSILLFAMFIRNKNLLVSFAGAFVATIVISIITMEDPLKSVRESFELIFPNTDSAVKFNKITVGDLVQKYGEKDKLKQVMAESDVPFNLSLVDRDAPKIASYLEASNMQDMQDMHSL